MENKQDVIESNSRKGFVIAFIVGSILVQVIAFMLYLNGDADVVAFFFIEVGGEIIAALFAVLVMAMMR